AALAGVDLAGFDNEPPLALSFGQQKRVALAAVMAMESRLLAMDEPTAGQDYRHYMEFMRTVLGISESFLFITHDLDLAISFANRVWLMAQGHIVADGPPHEALADPERLSDCRL